MRKVLSIVVLLVISVSLFAQKDVTMFMGIPVDGYKSEMVQKLKGKGFVSSLDDRNILEGEFNGNQVFIHVVTTNNKVSRIVVGDANAVNEADIRIRFNRLCQQFKNNSKYTSFNDYTIPEDEDISYEMIVNKKRYEAVFYQNPVITDSTAIARELMEGLLQKHSAEELENPTEEIKKEITEASLSYVVNLMFKKPVWFVISEFYGKYYIAINYDNEYNRANGEDL